MIRKYRFISVFWNLVGPFFILICLTVFFYSGEAFSDGRFYSHESIPPGVPYQRAIIVHDGISETLILQSQYDAGTTHGNRELAWVVPVPSVPELASIGDSEIDSEISQLWGDSVFFQLDRETRPDTVNILPILLRIFALIAILLILWMLILFLPFFRQVKHRRMYELLAVLSAVYLISLVPVIKILNMNVKGPRDGVEIITSESVGIYDVKVVRATESSELVSWLNENGFRFQQTDTAVFSYYTQSGWFFVTARVRSEEDISNSLEGLADPLFLRFASKDAVYPLRLTGAAGTDTEILIYLVSRSKMTCGDRIPLRYSGRRKNVCEVISLPGCETPPKFFSAALPSDLSWLAKFKGKLSPKDMATDLVFTRDSNDEEYRETVVRW